MQFCCVKYTGENTFTFFVKRSIVLLMLFLFAGMPVVEMLHSHDDEPSSGIYSHEKVDVSHAKCQFCHHFAQHQPIPLISISSLSLLHFEVPALLVKPAPDQGLMSLPGVSWTNKGPPVLYI